MTSPLLSVLLNATAGSSCGVLLILLLRKPFRVFFGPSLAYFLWLIVPAALLVSLLPAPSAGSKVIATVPLSIPSLTSQVARMSVSSAADWTTWLLCAWAIGALLLAWRLARQQRQFVASLGTMRGVESEVLRSTHSTGGPVVVGILRPRIIVPHDFDTRYAPEEQVLILAHERMHVRRGDLLVNALCALVRCIFWFNPLIHLAGRLIRFDQELACDAAVMRNHPHSRKRYANAMLRTQLADGAFPLGCHWSSTHPLKERMMALKHPPARGLRRLVGQALLGIGVALVGYGSWAAQAPAGVAVRVSHTHPQIDISSDSVHTSEQGFRFVGNVTLKVVGHGTPFRYDADNVSTLDGDTKGVLLVGHVRIEVDGRVFTTGRAVMLPRGVIKTDELEVTGSL